jgi:hypothetical protein
MIDIRKKTSRFEPLLMLLVLGAEACAPVPAPGHPNQTRRPDGGPGDVDESDGLQVVTGVARMSGGSEVTCTFEQDGGVQLQIAVVPECDTDSPLWLLVQTKECASDAATDCKVGWTSEVGLPRRAHRTFLSPRFPMPPAGTVVRTRVKANCSGVGGRKIWATAHCEVP